MAIYSKKIVNDGKPSIQHKKEIILIIEDDAIIGMEYSSYAARIRKKAPHIEIVVVPTVAEALEFYKTNIDHIKTVVVDDSLEDKEEAGPEITREIITHKLNSIIFSDSARKDYTDIRDKINSGETLNTQERALVARHVNILANSASEHRNNEILNSGASEICSSKSYIEKLVDILRSLSEAVSN